MVEGCRPLRSVRVSTAQWKHVHYAVETRTLRSGRQLIDFFQITNRLFSDKEETFF